MKRIIIASTQYAYYGGAATNAYALIKYFRSAGYKAAGIFFDNSHASIDPDKIGGVWRINSPATQKNVKKSLLEYLQGNPDFILAKNYAAPVASKNMFPDVKVAYLVAGCPHMIEMSSNNISAQRYMTDKKAKVFEPESICIKASDFIIPNSVLGRNLLIKHYGDLKKISDPINTSIALNHPSNTINPFNKRTYDIAFICSNLDRKVKNADLALKIFKNFPNIPKIVVGNNNKEFSKIPMTKVLNILPHKDVMNILGDSRLTVCTSFYDASPNTIREALSLQTNILLSKNCGWSDLYPTEFVCSDVYNLKEWTEKAEFLIKNNINFKLEDGKNIVKKIEDVFK